MVIVSLMEVQSMAQLMQLMELASQPSQLVQVRNVQAARSPLKFRSSKLRVKSRRSSLTVALL